MRRFLFSALALSAVVLAGCGSDLHILLPYDPTNPDADVRDRDAMVVPMPEPPPVVDGGSADSGGDAQAAADAVDASAPSDTTSDAPVIVQADTSDAATVPDVLTADAPATADGGECADGLTRCGGACVSVAADRANCGACGRACSSDHATSMCLSGECAIVRCAEGYADCDGDPANGCEASLTSPEHCAVCSNTCASRPGAAPSCAAGACVWSCLAGRADCDSSATNGCEVSTADDRLNCGACGHRCGFGMICTAGACAVDPSFQPVAPCLHESDYVRSFVVGIDASDGYAPRCVRIARGSSLMLLDMSIAHPMSYRPNEGTEPSPLGPYVGAVLSRSVVFPNAGFFPFRCTTHDGESGVVWVE